MAESSAEQEPTMEEILASIRRIINEDDEAEEGQADTAAEAEPEAEAAEPAEAEADDGSDLDSMPEDEAEDDVLELTERVDEPEGAGTDPMAIADDLMILDREDEPEAQAEPDPEPEPEPAMAVEPEPEPEPEMSAPEDEAEDETEDSLLDAASAGAAGAAFAALSQNLKVSSDGGTTLEAIVREMMRPMLKQWLDDNLPAIVEEKVEAEIERVARRRR